MFTTAVLTMSDKGHRGERVDESGPLIKDMMEARGSKVVEYAVVPDEKVVISAILARWADRGDIDLILTNGGTGLGPRDNTPEATLAVVDRLVPGLAEAMRTESYKKTPAGILSRGVAGLRRRTLIINLPGSPKAVKECLEAILPAIPHAIEMTKGEAAECASRTDLHYQGK
ncbi:MAG: MogA/MoaB family molybdenum cofactor biosynthesis protein [Chloroflexi bacterium]|nr:MogA/MoaB family molybdenum cofactor biosynthesis protein [Chloroflexota bacterium]